MAWYNNHCYISSTRICWTEIGHESTTWTTKQITHFAIIYKAVLADQKPSTVLKFNSGCYWWWYSLYGKNEISPRFGNDAPTTQRSFLLFYYQFIHQAFFIVSEIVTVKWIIWLWMVLKAYSTKIKHLLPFNLILSKQFMQCWQVLYQNVYKSAKQVLWNCFVLFTIWRKREKERCW